MSSLHVHVSRLPMFRRSGWLLTIALAATVALLPAAALASDEGQAAADLVSLASYQGFMNNSLYTHTGQSRGPSGAQHDPARDNIRNLFLSFGLTTTFDTFTYNSQTWENVVAEQTGTLYPNAIYIIGGHYDSASTPGADDNASGVALVLEAARILSQYPSDYTIRYMAFDMEEAGLIGSAHYASTHASEDIRGMISL
ncbi:MAG: M28 family peptidase, partial [Mycobacterium sp.]|nr:M28 family peptidase [Mycobacterium sp.]